VIPAWVADALTLSRALLGALLALVLAQGWLSPAAALLSTAWLTDLADGRVARAAGGPTRLGAFDLAADTLVGIGVLVGLAAGGAFPMPVAAIAILVLGGGYVFLRNEALAMSLQAIGYAAFLWRLWTAGSAWVWIPVLTVAVIAIADRRRFTGNVLPRFFGGLRSALALRRASGSRLPSDGP